MKKLMLIGKTGSGKTTLCQVLHNKILRYKKTQAVEFFENAIDTPGEYIENRFFYKALIVSSADADIIGFIQDATSEDSLFPPGFSSIFAKPVIGIVSKIDCCSEKEIQRAENYLISAGADKIFKISSTEITGINQLENYLK